MSSTTGLSKLQKIQSKCIKLIILDANNKSYQVLKILKIKDLIKIENCKFGYKLKHHKLPPRVEELSKTDQHGNSLKKRHKYNTRRKNYLNKALAINKRYKSCIIYLGTSTLESLKVETQNRPNLHSFIFHCKNEFWANYRSDPVNSKCFIGHLFV